MKENDKANILDVANYAGMSKSTVSRVLNNKGYVAKRTREKIEEAIRALNYSPSAFAQNIRTRKSRTIAMMIPDTSNTFYMEIFKAVEDVALRNDYMVIMCDTRRSFENEKNYADKLLKRNIDGLLYFTQQRAAENQEYFTQLSRQLPLVFMDYAFAELPGICCVAAESRHCTSDAVEYLYRKGRRHIAYINLPLDPNVTLLRCEGYQMGLEKCGLRYTADMVAMPHEQESHSLVDAGINAARKIVENNKKVDAVMAASDQMAIGAIKYLRSVNLSIPGDISVIGFDNTDLCEIVSPTLTTIKQPIKQIGKEAARLLLNLIMEEPVSSRKIIYNGVLVERHST
jgi:DNA-binding LacI/PurR family transcriptional regulator